MEDDWSAEIKEWGDDEPKRKNKAKEQSERTKRRSTDCIELSLKYEYRRAFSETQLLDAIGLELKEGYSYNCITGGDVDALSYLKIILRHQNVNHLILSTWCMAAEDVLQIQEWVQKGKIKKLDMYLGEIFPGTYKIEYKMILDFYKENNIGRVAIFKNHSKIFAGIGDKFAFGIQTSANINTNPRTENGCITICKEIYEFYKAYFDGIVSFDKNNTPVF